MTTLAGLLSFTRAAFLSFTPSEFHTVLSHFRAMVRQVDCVTVKGSKKPIGER